mmetsp:Transcript_37330/g.33477  ORF Transcript_37330/g.33477 Transcript_37330/m.33477 type:complete len:105 (+) Transcript_37330:1028-1342(+)
MTEHTVLADGHMNNIHQFCKTIIRFKIPEMTMILQSWLAMCISQYDELSIQEKEKKEPSFILIVKLFLRLCNPITLQPAHFVPKHDFSYLKRKRLFKGIMLISG